jgi:hypothetical protein
MDGPIKGLLWTGANDAARLESAIRMFEQFTAELLYWNCTIRIESIYIESCRN